MKVTVRRDGGAQEFSIALEKMPEAPPTAAPVRGVTLRPLRPMERSMLGFMQPTGLRVEKVDPASPLAGILRPRMNVLHVGGADRSEIVEVATVAEFEDLLDKFASTGGWFITRKPGDGDVAFPPLP